ncbi:hypothetical protein EQ831_18220 [Pseudomonas sp. ALS1279]|nr:hypothetical protein EQ831_18220 [Pseudomonas sp. ALS1279]
MAFWQNQSNEIVPSIYTFALGILQEPPSGNEIEPTAPTIGEPWILEVKLPRESPKPRTSSLPGRSPPPSSSPSPLPLPPPPPPPPPLPSSPHLGPLQVTVVEVVLPEPSAFVVVVVVVTVVVQF